MSFFHSRHPGFARATVLGVIVTVACAASLGAEDAVSVGHDGTIQLTGAVAVDGSLLVNGAPVGVDDALSQRVAALEATVVALQAQQDAAAVTIAELESENEALTQRLDTAETSVDGLQSALAEQQQLTDDVIDALPFWIRWRITGGW